ncbi:MAG TPA: sugar ABC transporter substrate-binding protein [Jiangellaceae bacterium]|jgi:simple sugar transport system substrate-binding protein|nr:sugar ABC transporter substrate-binding protein [Jiangellaceae bacterium]
MVTTRFTKRRALIALLALPLALAACTDDDGGNDAGNEEGGGGGGSDFTFAVVTHASAGDAFWDVVQNGAEAAAEDLGIEVTYQGSGEPDEQAQLIEAAVSDEVDGIVVSLANPDAMREPLASAEEAGIPVITINSGENESASLGAITHVGQTETVAGQGAGEQLAEAGVTNLICVIHEPGNIGLEQRCEGANEGLGGTLENLQVDINDVAGAQTTIQSSLQADPSINGVLALNPAIGVAAVDAVAGAGSQAQIATFDLSGDVVSAIEDGSILFAVDQQQYLQGYVPIVLLKLYQENNNIMGGGLPVLTGPGFVTQENAATVADLAEAGTR